MVRGRGAEGAKGRGTGEVVNADRLPRVPVPAARAVLAEAAVVPGAVGHLPRGGARQLARPREIGPQAMGPWRVNRPGPL